MRRARLTNTDRYCPQCDAMRTFYIHTEGDAGREYTCFECETTYDTKPRHRPPS